MKQFPVAPFACPPGTPARPRCARALDLRTKSRPALHRPGLSMGSAVTVLLLLISSSRTLAQTLYNFVRIDNPDFVRPSGLGIDAGEPSLNESGRAAFGG